MKLTQNKVEFTFIRVPYKKIDNYGMLFDTTPGNEVLVLENSKRGYSMLVKSSVLRKHKAALRREKRQITQRLNNSLGDASVSYTFIEMYKGYISEIEKDIKNLDGYIHEVSRRKVKYVLI